MAFDDMVGLWTPKSTSEVHECQDIFGYHDVPVHLGGRRIVRAALADGATTGFDAQAWAAILVERFFDHPEVLVPEAAPQWFAACRKEWSTRVLPEDAPWYVSVAHRRGSAATFLAVGVDVDAGAYRAVACGDTCLFHVRAGALVEVFPSLAPADFGDTPQLVRTADEGVPLVSRNAGLQRGDSLLLASDALAHALLSCDEAGSPMWAAVCQIGPHEFQDLVVDWRIHGTMDDDDTTLVRLRAWQPEG